MGCQIARQIEGDGALRLAAAGQRILDAPADLLRGQGGQILARPEPYQDQAPCPGRFRRGDEIQMLVALAGEAPSPHGAGEHATEFPVEPGGKGRELPARIGAEDEDRRLGRQALDNIDLQWRLPLRLLRPTIAEQVPGRPNRPSQDAAATATRGLRSSLMAKLSRPASTARPTAATQTQK